MFSVKKQDTLYGRPLRTAMDQKTARKYFLFTFCIIWLLIFNLRYVKKATQTHVQRLEQNQDLEMHDLHGFFKYIETPQKTCNHSKGFGGYQFVKKRNNIEYTIVDGDRVLCLDKVFDIKPGNCIVYSFGINNEWSFDDAMAGFGCQVYSFDPTINQKSHKRGDNISFYDIGIGKTNGIVKIKNKFCKVKRFTSIMALLGHGDEVIIDFLKLDVEGAEIDFLEDVFQNSPDVLKRIKQIGMEIHPNRYSISRISIFKKYYKLLKLLERHGFKLFSSKGCPYPSSLYFLSDVGRKVDLFTDLVWGRWPDSH